MFFNLNDDLVLALWPKASLTKDAMVADGPTSPAQFSISHNVKSKSEVDAVMAIAEKAGAKVTAPAHDQVWGGYSGYFLDLDLDLDGHLWEIAWNPQWSIDDSDAGLTPSP